MSSDGLIIVDTIGDHYALEIELINMSDEVNDGQLILEVDNQ
jgi:hypothetical protein